MLNRKTASFEHKNRPHQEMSLTRKDTGELHMPAKRIATEAQRKKSSGSKYSSVYFAARRAARVSGKVASHNLNGINVKSERRYQAPVVTSNHGCQSPNTSLLHPPAARLVGVELNPGPVVRQAKNKKQQRVAISRLFPLARKVKRAQGKPQRRVGISAGAAVQRGKLLGEITRIPYKEECLGTISTSVGFTNAGFILNAGNSTTFPWLGSISPKWEYYKFNKLHLKFVSSSADAVGSTNTALGTMLFNTNYDVLDPLFASQLEMEDYGGGKLHAETVPSRSITHLIEPQGERGGVTGGWRYVLPSTATTAAAQPYPASSSAHDYDIGLMQVASSGSQAASVAGRLYICYQVDFANPKLVPGAPVGAIAHFSSVAATTANNLAGAVLQAGATLGGVVLGVNTITFPANVPGTYLVQLNIAGATSATLFGQTPSAGATSFSILTSGAVRDSAAQVASNAGTTTAAIMMTATYTVAATGGLVTLTPSTIVGAGSVDLFIIALPSSILTADQQEHVELGVLRSRADRQDAKIERLMSLLSGASTPSGLEEDEQKSSDELGSSVHIPRAMLARFLRSDETFLPPGKVAAK